MGKTSKISINLLDLASRVSSLKTGVTFEQASRVSYSRTGVTSKIDRLGLTPSGYPSGTHFGSIQNLLERASRVSFTRTGVSSKVDPLGLTPSGYPSETHFGGTP